MKKLLFILTLLPTIVLAQDRRYEFGFSVGNNGQLDKTLNDFYFWGHETAYLDDSKESETTNLKYTASFQFIYSKSVSFRVKFGKYKREDFYTNIDPTSYIDYSIDHKITNISPSICFSKKIDQFEITTGIEIPLIFVNDFDFVSTYRVLPDSVTVTQEVKSKRTMDGGFIWGINSFIGLKYHFTDFISLGTEVGYGLLFADIGGKMLLENEKIIPTPSYTTAEVDKKYKKTFFSGPEVSLGIFIAVGNRLNNR